MRDLLILSIVGAGALMALARPWVGVMLWTWLSIMNPHRFGYSLAYSAPLAAVAAGATLLGLLFTKERRSPFLGAPVWWLVALTVWITLSWQLGLDPVGDRPMWERVMKIYLMTFVALALLKTKNHINAFAWVAVASIGILAAKGGLFTILNGGAYRVFGPPDSFIEDNNDFALATVIAIPMLHFLQLRLPKGWMRHAMSVVMLLCAASALGSHSRGGLLALLAMGAVFWFRSSQKALIACMAIVVAAALLPMMPEQWWSRMETIGTYTQDTSAMGRINAWHVAWHTALQYFWGGGMSYQHQFLFDQYGPYETIIRSAHSIYFQILGNHGFVGLALFLGVWFSTFRSAGLLRKDAKGIPEAQWAQDLGAMVQVSLIGYAIGGAFLSLPYFDFPYDLMVMAVLARDWVKRRAWETEPAVPFLQTLGFGKRRQPSGAPATRPGGSPASFVRPRGTGAGRAGDQRLNR